MQLKTGNRAEDVDEIYTALCKVLDSTDQASKPLYLARLCLLLIGELDKKDCVMELIDRARVSV